MPPPRVWQAATLVATAAALYLAFVRPRTSPADAPRELAADDDAPRAARPAAWAGGGDARARAGHSRVPRLAAQLRAARGPRLSCELITALGDTGERAAVGPLVEALQRRTDDEVRACAATQLARVPCDAALDALMQAAREPGVRAAVFGALARSDDPGAVAVVIDAAREEPDPAVRVEALVALGEARRPEGAALIAAALADDEYRDSWERLIPALGHTGDPAALPALERLVHAGDPSSVELALAALGTTGLPDAVASLREVMTEGGRYASVAAEALVNSNAPGALEALLATARADGPEGAVALAALAQWDGEEPRELMLARLHGARDGLDAAVDYFARRHDRLVVPELLARARAPDAVLDGEFWTEALVRVGGDAARDALLELSRDGGEPALRDQALSRLARTPGGRALAGELALRRVREGDEEFSAYDALASVHTPEARAALVTAATRPEDGTVVTAVNALAAQRDPASTSALEAVARDAAAPAARAAALDELWRRGAALDQLRAALSSGDNELRQQAQVAVVQSTTPATERVLVELARTGGAEQRGWAARLLAQRGSRDGLTQLEAIAQRDPDVARASAYTLAQNAPRRAAGLLAEMARRPDEQAQRDAVVAASTIDAAYARPALLAALASASPEIARVAASNLARDASSEAGRALLELLGREQASATVRRAAAEALRQRGGAEAEANRAAIDAVLASTPAPVQPEPEREIAVVPEY